MERKQLQLQNFKPNTTNFQEQGQNKDIFKEVKPANVSHIQTILN